ncbi:MAG TPA: PIN domain-containing protein [Anaerolineae bacterium]|nr:PIN domain-containing protein [Anaerolineae bacterium]
MIRAVADTHAIIWYLYNDARLSPLARASIEDAAVAGEQIALSSTTLAEMVYLIEKDRIDAAALTRLAAALDEANAVLVDIPFDRHIARTMGRVARSQVPDLPDRIIAATALHLGVPVISRDRKIQASGLKAIW